VLVNEGPQLGPLTPAHGDFVQTPRGLASIHLEGFSEDLNEDGYVDPVVQTPVVQEAPVYASYAATPVVATGHHAYTYAVPQSHAVAPLAHAVAPAAHAVAPAVHAVAPVTYTYGGHTAHPVAQAPVYATYATGHHAYAAPAHAVAPAVHAAAPATHPVASVAYAAGHNAYTFVPQVAHAVAPAVHAVAPAVHALPLAHHAHHPCHNDLGSAVPCAL
jgi:hypothetical protein